VTSAADQNANVIFGAVIDEGLSDEVRVTVIATGFGPSKRQRRRERQALPAESRPQSREGFDLPADVLDVPSFLRDD
jgi:cell division protein FtsZ